MTCLNAIALFNNIYVNGTVEFHQNYRDRGTYVDINLSNLTPGDIHAIHIHEYGDERQGCESLGGHWNPKKTTHGSIFYNMPSHAGDMINNIMSDKYGGFKYKYYDPRISLKGDVTNSIIGRSVVIHFGEDDLGLGGITPYDSKVRAESLKTGNAGGRMACAIIGQAKPEVD